jgi:hypothetical protein
MANDLCQKSDAGVPRCSASPGTLIACAAIRGEASFLRHCGIGFETERRNRTSKPNVETERRNRTPKPNAETEQSINRTRPCRLGGCRADRNQPRRQSDRSTARGSGPPPRPQRPRHRVVDLACERPIERNLSHAIVCRPASPARKRSAFRRGIFARLAHRSLPDHAAALGRGSGGLRGGTLGLAVVLDHPNMDSRAESS